MKITHTNRTTTLSIYPREDATYLEVVGSGLSWWRRRELSKNAIVDADAPLQVDLSPRQVRRVSAFAMRVISGDVGLSEGDITRDQTAMIRNLAFFLPTVASLSGQRPDELTSAPAVPQMEVPALEIFAMPVANSALAA